MSFPSFPSHSVMHYGAYAFSRGGKTITTKNPCYESLIGRWYQDLSLIDIKLLNMMYKCGDACPADSRCPEPCFQAQVCSVSISNRSHY